MLDTARMRTRSLVVCTPAQIIRELGIRGVDANHGPHPARNQRVEILGVHSRQEIREPVEAGIGIRPCRARLEQQFLELARLVEARGVRAQLQYRDVIQPARVDVLLGSVGYADARQTGLRSISASATRPSSMASPSAMPPMDFVVDFTSKRRIDVTPRVNQSAAANDHAAPPKVPPDAAGLCIRCCLLENVAFIPTSAAATRVQPRSGTLSSVSAAG